MAEEAGAQTTSTVTTTETDATTTSATDTTKTGVTGTDAGNTTTDSTDATGTTGQTTPSFSKEDIDWGDGSYSKLSDEQKDNLTKQYGSWFKGKDEVNSFIKALNDAEKVNKENRAKQVQELEAGWEKSLKTDANFGKDYEGNKKKVNETLRKFSSEEEMAELEKFGFTKSPVLNRVILKIANEFADAKVAGVGTPSAPQGSQPKDRFGNSMFDFSKKTK